MNILKKGLVFFLVFSMAICNMATTVGAEYIIKTTDPPIQNDTPISPEWLNELIIYQLRIDGFTPEGTIKAAIEKLPYLSDLGITGVWLSPTFKSDSPLDDPIIYNNFRTKEFWQIDDKIGTLNDMRTFVETAHKYNIKVFQDIITHGISEFSSTVEKHPNWFKRNADGTYAMSYPNMPLFDWNNVELKQWFIGGCVKYVIDTNIDGYRCDLEPHITGNYIYKNVRDELKKIDKEIVLFSEMPCPSRGNTYDFEQVGLGLGHPTQGSGSVLDNKNIVDVIKSGSDLQNMGNQRFYTYAASVHDGYGYSMLGSTYKFGYEMILSPFIPIMFMGEEFNAPNYTMGHQTLFANSLNWDYLNHNSNNKFYNKAKKIIQIRNDNAKIYSRFPQEFREKNIVKVPVNSGDNINSYAIYNDDTALVIAGNEGSVNKDIWSLNGGSWSVKSGRLTQTQDNFWGANVAIKNKKYKNFNLNVNVGTNFTFEEINYKTGYNNLPKTSQWVGIQFAKESVTDTNKQSGYTLLWRANTTFELRYNNEIVAAGNCSNKSSNPWTQSFPPIAIEVNGENIKIYGGHNRDLVIDYTANDEVQNGYVGLIAGGGKAYFDNFCIEDIDTGDKFEETFSSSVKSTNIYIPIEAMNLGNYSKFEVEELTQDKKYGNMNREQLINFNVEIPDDDVRVFKIKGLKSNNENRLLYKNEFLIPLFDEAKTPLDITSVSGKWINDGGKLHQVKDSNDEAIALVKDKKFRNFTAEFEMQQGQFYNSKNKYSEVIFGIDDDGYDGYYLRFYSDGGVALLKNNEIIAEKSTGRNFNKTTFIKVVVKDVNIMIYVNDLSNSIIQLKQSVNEGKIGFGTSGIEANFDNLFVY